MKAPAHIHLSIGPPLTAEEHRQRREVFTWVQSFLARVSYKPGYRISARPVSGFDVVLVEIAYRPADSEQPGYHVDLGFRKSIDFLVLLSVPDRDHFMRGWLEHTLFELEEHELHEWFRIDGARVEEPHPQPEDLDHG